MDFLLTLLMGLGLGIAIGAAVAATGRVAAPTTLLGLLAMGLGLAAGAGLAAAGDDSLPAGLIGGLAGSILAIAVLGGFVAAAGRRAGSVGGLAVWILPIAVVIAALSYLFPPLAVLPLVGLIWLGVSRRRREPRKYKGLRSLT